MAKSDNICSLAHNVMLKLIHSFWPVNYSYGDTNEKKGREGRKSYFSLHKPSGGLKLPQNTVNQ